MQVLEVLVLSKPQEVLPQPRPIVFIQLRRQRREAPRDLKCKRCNFSVLVSLRDVQLLDLLVQSLIELFNFGIISHKQLLEIRDCGSVYQLGIDIDAEHIQSGHHFVFGAQPAQVLA